MLIFDKNINIMVMTFFCRVVSLEMSPISDQFVSGAVNEGVRLWDLRSPTFLVLEYL